MSHRALCFAMIFAAALQLGTRASSADGNLGYYRYPAIGHGFIVFTAEGDLWRVPETGGLAQRLTSDHGYERAATISPDGSRIAFCGEYDGPTEVYTIPLTGGLPQRLTFSSFGACPVSWRDNERLIYATYDLSTLPDRQLVEIDTRTGYRDILPLAQAADGVYASDSVLYFVRLPWQGSYARNYPGGTAQNLWRFGPGDAEALPLTADYAGASKSPMWFEGRLYFASDRDGAMNIWSMKPDGGDLRQHTRHEDWDIQSPSIGDGKIVYQLGADIRLYDIRSDSDRAVDIMLSSDFDQMRPQWVEKPTSYLTTFHLSYDNSRVAITARDQVFVAPVEQGRLVEATRESGVRYRYGRFLPGDSQLVVLSDQSGEVEFWTLAPDGTRRKKQLSGDGSVLRFEPLTTSRRTRRSASTTPPAVPSGTPCGPPTAAGSPSTPPPRTPTTRYGSIRSTPASQPLSPATATNPTAPPSVPTATGCTSSPSATSPTS